VKLIGPDRYQLKFSATRFRVYSPSGTQKLSPQAQARRPKLYVVARRGQPVYVGITNQPIRSRLRLGWKADGTHGYYGYAFRRHLKAAALYVWFHPRVRGKAAIRELETVEAEVAYLVRKRGQWPAFQTEIHFYPSRAAHRRVAKSVVTHVRRAR
jgi:hypothetical protein